jgi:hypothetical protein
MILTWFEFNTGNFFFNLSTQAEIRTSYRSDLISTGNQRTRSSDSNDAINITNSSITAQNDFLEMWFDLLVFTNKKEEMNKCELLESGMLSPDSQP